MQFSLKLTSKGALSDVVKRQIPFATSKMLNAVTIDVQEQERQGARSAFKVRRQTWLDRSFKITKFAKKNDLHTRLEISPPGDPTKADIISKFEDGGTKTPTGRSIAVPVDARRSKSDVITPANRPKALLAKGKAFLIRSQSTGKGVIKQRKGRGKRATEVVLYGLTKLARIPKRLSFFAIARATLKRQVNVRFEQALRDALRTARR